MLLRIIIAAFTLFLNTGTTDIVDKPL